MVFAKKYIWLRNKYIIIFKKKILLIEKNNITKKNTTTINNENNDNNNKINIINIINDENNDNPINNENPINIINIINNDNNIIDNKILIKLINIFYHMNLKHFLKINDYKIVYEMDNLIFYDDNKTSYISKIILNIELIYKSNTLNITERIKKYSLNTPIYIIVNIEKYNINATIKFSLLGTEFNKKIIDILDNTLYDIIG
jgi:hypothetical protein